MWPGATHFPDFLGQAGVEYWGKQLHDFHSLANYDGLWIDMNEASNFCTGEVCSVPLSGTAFCLGDNSLVQQMQTCCYCLHFTADQVQAYE